MSSRRTLILIAAALVGAIAAYALFTYVGGIEDEANDNAERVEIFKIVQDIPKGTFGDEAFTQGLIESDVIAKEYRPLPRSPIRRRSTALWPSPISPANQVVVSNQFVVPGGVAVHVLQPAEEQRGRGHHLDRPDPRRGRPPRARRLREPPGHGAGRRRGRRGRPANRPERVFSQPARVLFQKVQILAVGQTRKLEPGETAETNADGTPATPTTSGLITFVVPAAAAQQIASVEGSQFYLTLVAKDYQPTALGPIDTAAALPGETGSQLTPYGPDGTARVVGLPPQPLPSPFTHPVLRQGPAPIATNPLNLVPVAVLDDDLDLRDRMVAQLGSRALPVDSLYALQERLTGGPTVLVLGPSCASASSLAEIGATLQSHREVGTILVTDVLSTDLLQTALRAGRERRARRPGRRRASSPRPWRGWPRRSTCRACPASPTAPRRSTTADDGRPRQGHHRLLHQGRSRQVDAGRQPGRGPRPAPPEKPVVLVDADLQFGDVAVMLKLAPQHTIVDAVGSLDRLDPTLLQPVPDASRAVGPADPPGAARAVVRRSDQRGRDGADRPAAPHLLQRGDHRHAGLLQRGGAGAHRGERRGPPDRGHGHPEHQEREDRAADPAAAQHRR